jgi:hypothetical protein
VTSNEPESDADCNISNDNFEADLNDIIDNLDQIEESMNDLDVSGHDLQHVKQTESQTENKISDDSTIMEMDFIDQEVQTLTKSLEEVNVTEQHQESQTSVDQTLQVAELQQVEVVAQDVAVPEPTQPESQIAKEENDVVTSDLQESNESQDQNQPEEAVEFKEQKEPNSILLPEEADMNMNESSQEPHISELRVVPQELLPQPPHILNEIDKEVTEASTLLSKENVDLIAETSTSSDNQQSKQGEPLEGETMDENEDEDDEDEDEDDNDEVNEDEQFNVLGINKGTSN